MLHRILEVALGDREVEAVDRAGLDSDEYLARDGLGNRQVVQGGRSPEVVDGDGSHAALLSTALAAYTMPALGRHRRSLRTTRARSEPALLGCANSVGRVVNSYLYSDG